MMKKLMISIGVLIFLIAVAGCTTQQADKQQTTATEETIKAEKVETHTADGAETTRTAETEKEEETINDGRRSDFGDFERTGGDDNSRADNVHTDNTQEVKTAEELADEVLNRGINGEEREAFLGERYDEVQRLIDEKYQISMPVYEYEEEVYFYQPDTGISYGDGALNPESGVNYYNGIMETYYSLPMDGLISLLYDLGYSGEYWIRADGVKMFGDYIIVAADFGQFPRGTVVQTSLGTGMVLDTGLGGYNWFDLATNWAD